MDIYGIVFDGVECDASILLNVFQKFQECEMKLKVHVILMILLALSIS